MATERLNAAQLEVTELSRLRRRVIQDLHAQGLSYAQIAKEAGLTRGRIHQIRHTGPAPEGAFLGKGTITLATPLKREATNARPVVAMEDVTAAKRLEDLARGFGLAMELEHVPLGGDIDLNRPNLIVICGPKLSPVMGALYESDPIFEWVKDDVWTLRDSRTGTTYRSGSDSDPEQPIDYAYLGRLPRPDGKGTVLVFTGIHPQGTLGVVQLLQTEIAALWGQVADKSFSTVISAEYDPETGEPVKAELASPLYLHEET
ncbi:sigma factor-like helix-turn-helix DNA-binding protein [Nonomuraea typhae]|uniref:sigma factor-like helix-turn-helix DNA-binding protein n=1 Tax=Nonomuraea typhae TaxID=2603600 RepID=UPI001FEA9A52|nr:sigma factor-like helix-turn-helix DNA-binding protein [Nonomuraea typhae]